MKYLFKHLMQIACCGCLLFAQHLNAQVCDNLSLAFDGNGDFINLSPTPAAVSGDANFTVEMQFRINSPNTTCTGNFRRLFVLSGISVPFTNSRFEVGECNQILTLYWTTLGGATFGPLSISPQLAPGCHHLAVIRNGVNVDVYMDNALTPMYSGVFTGTLNTNLFRVGHWHGGATPGQDWQGEVDDIRLWSVPRTANEIQDFKDCTLSGTIPDLVVNWTFNQTFSGVTPGGNNPGAIAEDMSGSTPLNNGTLFGFDLTSGNTVSNFVCNSCPPAYDFTISDLPSLFPISPISICEGDPVHFCVTENGNAITLPAGSMVMWESSDGGGPFIIDPDMSVYPYAQNALCFPIQAGVITSVCNTNLGHVNRKYRAVIQKKMGTQICTYSTPDRDLRICCPIKNTQLNFTVQPPTPFNNTLCEGAAVVDVSIISSLPFLVPISPSGFVSIQWFINGVYDPTLDNLLTINYSGPAMWPDLCFEARIQNCSCPVFSVKTCIPVDKMPQCGLIDGMSASLTPTGTPYDYLICPGDDAIVGMINPPDFKDCNPVWQFHLDTDPTGVWKDLGSSNSAQNTNTLPQLSPTNNPASPYLWPQSPVAAQCIYYRIECRPASWPNSGCDPCHSNVVSICLKQPPVAPIITSTASQICKGGFATLNITPVPGALSYTWYCNGLVIGSGPSLTSLNVSQYACYWVSAYDGCFTVTSPKFCLEVCEIVPIIKCPADNPCACNGLPISLSGCDSYNTCSNTGPLPLVFTWSASNGGPGTTSGPNGCEFIHTPDPNGTIYYLNVTDPNLGCTATTSLFIKPCI